MVSAVCGLCSGPRPVCLRRRAVTTLVANRVRALGANRADRETGVKLMADFGRRTITDTGHRVRTYPDEQVRDSILWKAQVELDRSNAT